MRPQRDSQSKARQAALCTNTWYSVREVLPWADKEVLCRMPDGTKRTLAWDGRSWYDPKTKIKQFFYYTSEQPTHFLIFEEFFDDKNY